jgi:Tol biopolymer transport system component
VFLYDTTTRALTNVTQGGNGLSTDAVLSADGSKLAFTSFASNLTSGDTNGAYDIFLYDTTTRAFTNVTQGGNGLSTDAVLSADGSKLAFTSNASNLTSGDTNGRADIFLYDTATHALTNVTQDGNFESEGVVLSADGSKLAFHSFASNLTSGDTNEWGDIFLYDTATRAFTNVTQVGNGGSGGAVLSADGSKLAFYSYASNLTPGDTNGELDIFLYDTTTHAFTNVTEGGNNGSYYPDLSADGSRLAFASDASNLTSGDTNGELDIFLYDTTTHALTNVTQGGNGHIYYSPTLSADGSSLAFYSDASNLTPDDTNSVQDIFLYDLI